MTDKYNSNILDLCSFYTGNRPLPDNVYLGNFNKYKNHIMLPNTPENQKIILDIIKNDNYTLKDFTEDDNETIYFTILNGNLLVLKYIEDLGLNLYELNKQKLLRYSMNSDNIETFKYILNKSFVTKDIISYKDNKLSKKLLYYSDHYDFYKKNHNDYIMCIIDKLSQ